MNARAIKIWLGLGLLAACLGAQTRTVHVKVALDQARGPMDMSWFALGQGGQSEEPIFADRIHEVRALRPKIIRLFLQEYFDLMPEPGRYHWDTLDASVDMILKAGARPLMTIAFKPKALFPKLDQDIVDPTSYDEWESLISAMVRHYKERGSGIRYWEVANEPDIGEDGGCPYRFKPDGYTRYYEHTARAILKADPEARVGGPALANVKSPLLPALLDAAASGKVPLHFISWHIYNSDPLRIRGTIEYAKKLMAERPGLRLETFLDEWNMSLSNPSVAPSFQPCFVAETAWQMKEAGLNYACYYHIRDYHVEPAIFAKFMTPYGVALMTKWWNEMAQYDGLFDFQNRVRPAYFTFRLLSRLTGDRLPVESTDPQVHGFASFDESLGRYNVMLWNYSTAPADVELAMDGIPVSLSAQRLVLDAAHPSGDENDRLRPEPRFQVGPGSSSVKSTLEPYGVSFLFMDKRR